MIKRAIMGYLQKHNLVKYPINNSFYKFFIVLSKARLEEIEKKIANSPKKDTITYIEEEFEKSWKWLNGKMCTNH